MWPKGHLAAMRNNKTQKFLFDATPEYLLNPAVAPRMKQMVPQAKIVIVLRVRSTRMGYMQQPSCPDISAWHHAT